MRSLAIVFVVFLCGMITGGTLIYVTREPAIATTPSAMEPSISIEERADRLTRRLGLRPEQRTRLLDVLRAHQARLRASRGEFVGAVRELLDDEQRRRFDAATGGGPFGSSGARGGADED